MSVECSAIVWRRNFGNANRKLVAIRLADHADDNGRGIWPAVASVAEQCDLSARTVQRILREFVNEGVLVVVRRGGAGRHSSTRYDFCMESLRNLPLTGADPKGDTVSPLDSAKGDNDDTRGDSHDTLGCHGVTQTVKEPSENRHEREGARDDEDMPLSHKRRSRLTTKLIDGWPKGTGSVPFAVQEIGKLSDDELVEAEAKMTGWLAMWRSVPRKFTPALSTYIKGRQWREVPDAPPPPPPPTTKPGKPAGKLWNSRLYQILLTEPMADLPEPATDFLRQQMAAEGTAGQQARLRHQAQHGWPEAAAMIRAADSGTGWSVGLELERLSERFVQVAAESPLYAAWRDEHARQGWPWLDRKSGFVWLPVPPGATEGREPAAMVQAALSEFRDALITLGETAGESEVTGNDDRAA